MNGRDPKPEAGSPRPAPKLPAAKPASEAEPDLDLELDEIEPNQRLKEGFTGQER